jgi:hypothetical protein
MKSIGLPRDFAAGENRDVKTTIGGALAKKARAVLAKSSEEERRRTASQGRTARAPDSGER